MQVTEKEIEDWVCENIEDIVGVEAAECTGRQVRLPTGGIMDVLATYKHGDVYTFAVIEIKREAVDAAALTQIFGYLWALQESIRAATQEGQPGHGLNFALRGVLVGQSLDENIAPALAYLAPHITFTKVAPTFTADPWTGVRVGSVNYDRFATIGCELIGEQIEEIDARRKQWEEIAEWRRDAIATGPRAVE